MCAIAGFLSKKERRAPIGKRLLDMLLAVGCRGPDSTGVAVFRGEESEGFLLRVKCGDAEAQWKSQAEFIAATAREFGPVNEAATDGSYLRLALTGSVDVNALVGAIERTGAGVEVVSAGRSLEVVKQVGSPQKLEETFGISGWTGTHGIGHTRLSTESRIDLSHSQPFWAHGLPDVATVHNGHITNYHILRRRYEQRGVHFFTENDSEIIGIYLRDRIEAGYSFEEALRASLSDFDGSFCYLAATRDTLAFVKDGYGFKPLTVAETDDWVAIATEEIAIRAAFAGEAKAFTVREPGVRRLHLWRVPVGEEVAA